MNNLTVFQILPYWAKNILSSLYGINININRKYKRKHFLNILNKREYFSFNEYQKWQEENIRHLLLDAVIHVPYYRNYWSNQNPSIDKTKIENWPILEKEIVRKQPELFLKDGISKNSLTKMYTSGTSGKPMVYYLDKDCIGLWYSLYDKRIKEENGIDLKKDKAGTFGGKIICKFDQNKPPFWVKNYFGNQIYFSSYHLKLDNVIHYINAIRKHKIIYLLGYTSSIFSLVQFANKLDIELPKLKLVITNAEPLFEYQREIISKGFGCTVIQTYSGCEFAFGGNEDSNGNMWLWPESGLLELLNENGKITKYGNGEFLATGLVNKSMPLIRYRIGDSGIILQPPYLYENYNKVLLGSVEGRTDDLILTPNGNRIGRLDPVFKSEFKIIEAQIVQESLWNLSLYVVEDIGFDLIQKEELIKRLKDRIGDQIQINYYKVDSIPRGPNGKYKAVISKVKRSEIK